MLKKVSQQVINLQDNAKKGDISELLGSATALASNVGGDLGQKINTYGIMSANVIDQAENGNLGGMIGQSLASVGQVTGGLDGL